MLTIGLFDAVATLRAHLDLKAAMKYECLAPCASCWLGVPMGPSTRETFE